MITRNRVYQLIKDAQCADGMVVSLAEVYSLFCNWSDDELAAQFGFRVVKKHYFTR